MDAPEDDLDIKLQKISGDLIADFDRSLGKFLRRPQDGTVRSRVRSRETERLVSNVSIYFWFFFLILFSSYFVMQMLVVLVNIIVRFSRKLIRYPMILSNVKTMTTAPWTF